MSAHIENRRQIFKSLYSELVGPAPAGAAIDCSEQILFESEDEFFAPHKQLNGEEILQLPPTKRYGVGILFPWKTGRDESESEETEDNTQPQGKSASNHLLTDEALNDMEQIEDRKTPQRDLAESEDDGLDISLANSFRPSSIGVSFRARIPHSAKLVVSATGGRYHPLPARLHTREFQWWRRSPIKLLGEVESTTLLGSKKNVSIPAHVVSSLGTEGLDLRIEVVTRPLEDTSNESLLTVCLVNRTKGISSHSSDPFCVFQCHFSVEIQSEDGEFCIVPYPESVQSPESLDEEEKSLALLYKNMKTYAIGHGCAANWSDEKIGDCVKTVTAETMPTYQSPSITPDILRPDGTLLTVSMVTLAGWNDQTDGLAELDEIITLYENWINDIVTESHNFSGIYKQAADSNLQECSLAAGRMRNGLAFLKSDKDAMLAFRLSNQAMIMQQVSSLQKPRNGWINEENIIQFETHYKAADFRNPPSNRGNWRAFQIAFLLMSISSTANPQDDDRDRVDLIWFPTGGGKTEAYLGLAAFSMFYQRLKHPNDTGVHALMRYTLRLLTAQQFQRASKLICAMELLRKEHLPLLGTKEFSIGIWVGGDTTPNTWTQAQKALSGMRNSQNASPFVLNHCPWCGAKFGEYQFKGGTRSKRTKKTKNQILGFARVDDSVLFECPDKDCGFYGHPLPIYVVDDDIYVRRPSLVIGTVDKFAMLAWRPQARSLFGLDDAGKQIVSPPRLIIQDELHLISGPLGSMAGLYETVIEELCTDRREEAVIRPKIVCSTATIRKYKSQVKSLYAREDVSIFPAPAIDVADSFFSRYAVKEDGTLQPGRMYVGVNAPALGSLLTAEVRAFSSVLQAPMGLSMEERDPWWTFLIFFNSLRELGTGLTLFQSDIPDYMGSLRRRIGLSWSQMRKLSRVKELTSRLSSDSITKAIDDLQLTTDSNPVDICLASSIIEVGIDIDRLSMMAVVGQPKTTAQYIQVTGRIGRRWWERPGLVLTLYSATKPRDRSHFERFRTYHERLYAQVEPTSVTPFAPPVVDRALHALMVAYVRQSGNTSDVSAPYPFPSKLLQKLRDIVMERARAVDDHEIQRIQQVFEERYSQWLHREPMLWQRKKDDESLPLMRVAGAYATRKEQQLTWAVPMSLRNVDAQCEGDITTLYVQEEDGE